MARMGGLAGPGEPHGRERAVVLDQFDAGLQLQRRQATGAGLGRRLDG